MASTISKDCIINIERPSISALIPFEFQVQLVSSWLKLLYELKQNNSKFQARFPIHLRIFDFQVMNTWSSFLGYYFIIDLIDCIASWSWGRVSRKKYSTATAAVTAT
jgi:hypothetical protein